MTPITDPPPLMSRRKRLLVWGVALLAALGGAAWWWYLRAPQEPVVQQVPRQGGLEVTLLAASDLHFGSTILSRDANGRECWVEAGPVRREMDGQMQQIAGKPYPPIIGGSVRPPRGLLVAGDLTEDGLPGEWQQFATFYGLTTKQPAPAAADPLPGTGQRLPVFECIGNHDQHTGEFVTRQVAARHGGSGYTIDYGDLHVVNLSVAPDKADLTWLQRDLAATGRDRPVILYMHYPLLGPYSNSWWGWQPELTERFAHILSGFNIIAILHGHYHVPGCYKWRGYDVYNIGSIKHGARCFGVIHVTDNTFTFASWNAQQNGWWWWHSKPINGTAGKETLDTQVKRGTFSRVAIPYPIHLK